MGGKASGSGGVFNACRAALCRVKVITLVQEWEEPKGFGTEGREEGSEKPYSVRYGQSLHIPYLGLSVTGG